MGFVFIALGAFFALLSHWVYESPTVEYSLLMGSATSCILGIVCFIVGA
jgi:hypothetical protein